MKPSALHCFMKHLNNARIYLSETIDRLVRDKGRPASPDTRLHARDAYGSLSVASERHLKSILAQVKKPELSKRVAELSREVRDVAGRIAGYVERPFVVDDGSLQAFKEAYGEVDQLLTSLDPLNSELEKEGVVCVEEQMAEALEELRRSIEAGMLGRLAAITKQYPDELSDKEAWELTCRVSKELGVDPPGLCVAPDILVEGEYFPSAHKILFKKRPIRKETLLHELLHATKRHAYLREEEELEQQVRSIRSLESMASHLNGGRAYSRRMATALDVAAIYGFQHVGKGLSYGFERVDAYLNRAALKPHERIEPWTNLGFAVACPLIALLLKPRAPIDVGLIAMGGLASTRIWDYAKEYTGSPTGGGGTSRTLSPGEAGYKRKEGQAPSPQVSGSSIRGFG